MSTYEVIVNGSYSGEGYGLIYHKSKTATESTCRMDVSGNKYVNFTVPNGNIVSATIKGVVYANADIDGFFTSDYSKVSGSTPELKYVGRSTTNTRGIAWSGTTQESINDTFYPTGGQSVSVRAFPNMGTIYIKPPFADSRFVINEKCGDISVSPVLKMYVTIEHSDPTITNLSTIGQFWEQPITINWRGESQQGYDYECYYNNVKIKDGIGGTEQQFTIPANTFTGTLPATIRVRTFNTRPDGVKVYSSWAEQNITLKDIEATISNLIIDGEYWEKPIKLSWRSENQEQLKIEVFKGNVLVKTYNGANSKEYEITPEQLTDGVHTFKVWVGYQNRYVNYTTKDITLKNVIPTINNISLSGSNIDLQLSLSWSSTDQQKYEVQTYKGDTMIKSYSGTFDKSIFITNGTLTTGLHKFKARVCYKDRWSDWSEINVTLVETFPSIGAFEPDGVIVKRDEPIRVWWTSQNQSKWSLSIDGSLTYSGESQTEHVLLPSSLGTGNHEMVLTVTYVTALGIEKPTNKKAKFIVQGKPPIPTIISGSLFTTSRPTIEWDTQDQEGWILEILKDNIKIWSSDWQNGLTTKRKVYQYLDNGVYVARVKIMNQYGIESDYGVKSFEVNASVLADIELKVNKLEYGTEMIWNNIDNTFIKFYVIRNGVVVAKCEDTIYSDYSCNGYCEYKVMGVTSGDVYKDSNIQNVDCTVKHGVVATINDTSDICKVGLCRGAYLFGGSVNLEHSTISLSGRESPVTVFGEHKNNSYAIKFTTTVNLFKFVDMCYRRELFIYRDARQTLYLTIPNPQYTVDVFGTQFTVNAIETDYSEVVEYD